MNLSSVARFSSVASLNLLLRNSTDALTAFDTSAGTAPSSRALALIPSISSLTCWATVARNSKASAKGANTASIKGCKTLTVSRITTNKLRNTRPNWLVASSDPPRALTKSVMVVTMVRRTPMSPASPPWRTTSWKAEISRLKSPRRVSSIVSEIALEAPSALFVCKASSRASSDKLARDRATVAPLIPKISTARFRSSWPSLSLSKTSNRLLASGLMSSIVKPRVFSAALLFGVVLVNPTRTRLRPAPALLAWMPALPKAPKSAEVSSTVMFRLRATGPTNLKASPSCRTLVLALAAVRARMSAIDVVSVAARPNCVMMFDAMSAASPRSSMPADARFKVPSRACTASAELKPARARNSRPSAACDAVNLVVAPRRRASSSRAANSAPVAPVMAATAAICCSNCARTRTVLMSPATIAAAPIKGPKAVTRVLTPPAAPEAATPVAASCVLSVASFAALSRPTLDRATTSLASTCFIWSRSLANSPCTRVVRV